MKNKYQLVKLIGILAIVVGVLVFIFCLQFLFNNSNWTGTLISLVIIAAGIITTLVGNSGARKFCNKCGASMQGCAYSYRQRRGYQRGEVYVYEIEFTAECPECGAQKRFIKNFNVRNDGLNIDYMVETFCEKTFGH